MSLAQRTTPLEFVDPQLEASVSEGLVVVERRLHEVVESGDQFLTEAASHLFKAGGKRFRPMLGLTAAHFGDPTADGVIQSALVMELTHLATLYHDDVMDEASKRRGAPSANSRWSNSIAILAGDYLFAVASELVAELGSDTVRTQARTFSRLVQGQIAETVGPPTDTDPIKWYLHVLAEKTGSLIATAAQLGAQFAKAPDEVVDAVAEFGEIIGVAFQLSDDLLDIASDGDTSGKVQGLDLMEGIPTLPVLYARIGEDTPERLRELISGPVAEEDLAETLTLLRASSAMDRARETLNDYGTRAKEIAAGLPACPARDALAGICDYMVARNS
ncbi:heptaprenyl diphosphate synthase [Stackebrandtia endophytica]|uniref:Heptaprenyl diphosphate synthase n=1 Tax=Stackebrandtia endophytica TaxID=1496996 RepID=A0A543AV78_9ACTN|nr:heptaprenyl diphosphate synthase [Stackebrandtia endophytica]